MYTGSDMIYSIIICNIYLVAILSCNSILYVLKNILYVGWEKVSFCVLESKYIEIMLDMYKNWKLRNGTKQ